MPFLPPLCWFSVFCGQPFYDLWPAVVLQLRPLKKVISETLPSTRNLNAGLSV